MKSQRTLDQEFEMINMVQKLKSISILQKKKLLLINFIFCSILVKKI